MGSIPTVTTAVRRGVSLAFACVLFSLLVACGSSSEPEAVTDSTTGLDPAEDSEQEESEPGETVEYNDGLPVSTTYGYLEWELTDAVITDAYDDWTEDWRDDDEQYAVFTVSVTNPAEDATFSVPLATIHLDVEDEQYPEEENTTLEVAPGDTEEGVVLYTVPQGTDLSDAELVIQEAADNPEQRRKPAHLRLNGDGDDPEEPVDLDVDPASFSHETYCENGGLVTINRAYLSEDLGYLPTGAALMTARGATGSNLGLGRAPDGMLWLTVEGDIRKTEGAPANCYTSISTGPMILRDSSGAPVEARLRLHNNWSLEPADHVWVFPVAEDLDSFTVDSMSGTEAAVSVTITR